MGDEDQATDETDGADEGKRRAPVCHSRRSGSRGAGSSRAPGGALSERDRAWIAASVAALPPPTVEEITGWCDILARLDGERHGHSDGAE